MADAPVSVSLAPPRSVAGIAGFAGGAGLQDALRAELGADLPAPSRCVQAGGVAVSCLAPGRFLASGGRDADLPSRLARNLAGLGAVTDQSDMWAVFALSGEAVRDVLARVVPIDLDPRQFREGHLALTRAGHLNVRLWRLATDGYEITVERSFAPDLHHALQHAAA